MAMASQEMKGKESKAKQRKEKTRQGMPAKISKHKHNTTGSRRRSSSQ